MAKPQRQTRTYTRAVIHRRVSTTEQKRHGYGLDDQLDVCTGLAERYGYTVVGVTTDAGISGMKPLAERPGLSAAIDMCLAGDADVLIVSATDRLSRDTELNAHFRNLLERAGVRLHSVKDGVLTGDANRFMGDILGAVAAKDRMDTIIRLRGGRQQRSKRDGMGSGFLPLGYRWYFNEDGVKHIGIDKEAAQAVREVLTLRDAGKSYAEIAQAMNAAGYKTAKGVVWTRESVRLVTDKRELYTTGVRQWDGITASEKWPIIYQPS